MRKLKSSILVLFITAAVSIVLPQSHFFIMAQDTDAIFASEMAWVEEHQSMATLAVQIDGGPLIHRRLWTGATVQDILINIQQERAMALIYEGNPAREAREGEILSFDSLSSRFFTEKQLLPYEIIQNHTSAVRQGVSHVRQAGQAGSKATTTAVMYVSGVEQNRAVVEQEIVAEPISKIIDIGTAPLGALTDTSAPDFHYVRRLRMNATAYTAGYGCTGKHPDDPWFGITASGRRVEHGIVAVDRNLIPLGTHLYVEGYGFAIAADVGGAIRGHRIDLFMWEWEDAIRFGRRDLYVYILE